MSGFLDTGEVVCYLSGDSFELAEEVAQIIDTEDELQLTDVVLAETARAIASHRRQAGNGRIKGILGVGRVTHGGNTGAINHQLL